MAADARNVSSHPFFVFQGHVFQSFRVPKWDLVPLRAEDIWDEFPPPDLCQIELLHGTITQDLKTPLKSTEDFLLGGVNPLRNMKASWDFLLANHT